MVHSSRLHVPCHHWLSSPAPGTTRASPGWTSHTLSPRTRLEAFRARAHASSPAAGSSMEVTSSSAAPADDSEDDEPEECEFFGFAAPDEEEEEE